MRRRPFFAAIESSRRGHRPARVGATALLLLGTTVGCQQGTGGFSLPSPWNQTTAAQAADVRKLQERLARAEQEANRSREELALARELLAEQAQRDLTKRLVERDRMAMRTAQASAATKPSAAADSAAPTSQTPGALGEVAKALQTPGLPVDIDGPVVRIRIPADRLFTPGSDRLLPTAAELLDPLAAQVRELFPHQKVSVEAYTDNGSAYRGAFRSGHELAAAQSAAVYQQLTRRNGMPSEQLLLVAQGPNYPRADNTNAAGRAENRRVELVIFPETF